MSGWIIGLIIAFTYIIQTTFVSYIAIFNIVPNLVLVVIICYSVANGKEHGVIVGLITGLFIDIIAGRNFGYNILMYTYFAALAGILGSNFFGRNAITTTIITILLSLLYGMLASLFMYITKTDRNLWYMLVNISVPSAVYNGIIAFFVYLVFDNATRSSYIYKRR